MHLKNSNNLIRTQGSDEHVNIDQESQGNDGHFDTDKPDQTAPLTLQSTFRAKKDQIIQFYLDEDGEHLQVAKIVSRAGKGTGQYKHWYNIEYIKYDSKSGEVSSLDIVRPGDCRLYPTQMLLDMVRDSIKIITVKKY